MGMGCVGGTDSGVPAAGAHTTATELGGRGFGGRVDGSGGGERRAAGDAVMQFCCDLARDVDHAGGFPRGAEAARPSHGEKRCTQAELRGHGRGPESI